MTKSSEQVMPAVGEEQPALFSLAELGIEQSAERFSRIGTRTAKFAGRVALRAAGAAIGAGIALNLFPYEADLAGVPVEVSVSTFADHGLSVDTTAGRIAYPHVTGLPLGLHVTPKDIDLSNIRSLTTDSTAFAKEVKHDFNKKMPDLEKHFLEVIVAGGLLGAGAADAARVLAFSYFSAAYRRKHFEHLNLDADRKNIGLAVLNVGRTATAGVAVMALASATYGYATYDSNWKREYAISGLLADAKALPGKLSQLYAKDGAAASKVDALLKLEDQITSPEEQKSTEAAAYNILFISDMHLRNMYPYLYELLDAKNIGMVINTGDEAEYGTRGEMTDEYLAGIAKIAKKIPFIFVAGNHDSPETIAILRKIPGVIVIGTKSYQPDGSIAVSGSTIEVNGLSIGGVPDPRVYGAPGVNGAEDGPETVKLEQETIKNAGKDYHLGPVDIGITHEPAAVSVLQKILKARLMASGHLHEENDPKTLEKNDYINQQEGSTGMGGLDHYDNNPMEFTIDSVAKDCQFTQLTRYKLSDPAAEGNTGNAQIATFVFKPQDVQKNRVCSTDMGVGLQVAWPAKNASASGKVR